MAAEEWYKPGDIRFNRQQIIWLLGYLPTLREGIWPPNPKDTGYVDAPQGKNSRAARGGYFERACDIAAEVEKRLEACHLDGHLLEASYTWGKSEAELARVHGLTLPDFYRRVNRALRYISGWRRKRRSYEEFCGHRRGR